MKFIKLNNYLKRVILLTFIFRNKTLVYTKLYGKKLYFAIGYTSKEFEISAKNTT
jgi:hypothetical protein